MVEGSGGASAPSCRGGALGPAAARRCCGCGLGRLVRRLRRQGRQALCAAARPSSSSAAEALRGCQYDPLSYARNFDHTGFGGDPAAASSLYYSYTFSSRFVLAPGTATATSSSSAAAAAATNGLVVAAAR